MRLAQELATCKKCTIFALSSWNLVKMATYLMRVSNIAWISAGYQRDTDHDRGAWHSVAGRIFLGSNTDYLLHHVNIPIYVHKVAMNQRKWSTLLFIDWTACEAEASLKKGKQGRIRLPKGSSELLPCWWWSQNRDRPFPPHFYPLLKNVFQP